MEIVINNKRPKFSVYESASPELGDKKVGQHITAIINYKVVEKTRQFIVIRITNLMVYPTKRII